MSLINVSTLHINRRYFAMCDFATNGGSATVSVSGRTEEEALRRLEDTLTHAAGAVRSRITQEK